MEWLFSIWEYITFIWGPVSSSHANDIDLNTRV